MTTEELSTASETPFPAPQKQILPSFRVERPKSA